MLWQSMHEHGMAGGVSYAADDESRDIKRQDEICLAAMRSVLCISCQEKYLKLKACLHQCRVSE